MGQNGRLKCPQGFLVEGEFEAKLEFSEEREGTN